MKTTPLASMKASEIIVGVATTPSAEEVFRNRMARNAMRKAMIEDILTGKISSTDINVAEYERRYNVTITTNNVA